MIETQASRDGYNVCPDVDGKYARDLFDLPGGETLWRDQYHAPTVLRSAVEPAAELWRRTESLLLQGKRDEVQLRLSDDIGHSLSGFLYYAGLVERWRKREERNVLFLHVKSECDDETLQEGREVVMAVIRAAVEMGELRRLKEEVEDEGLECRCGCVVD